MRRTGLATAEAGASTAGARIDLADADAVRAAMRHVHPIARAACRSSACDPDAVQAAVGAVVDQHGGVDVLVNNAGLSRPGSPT